jgi:large subunit ribosomal protein L35Ae
MMKGKIVSYRRSRNTQKNDQMLLKVEGVDSKENAGKLVGKKVVWKSKKAVIEGKINAAHGGKGVVRATFEKGMPGQSISSEVEIQ